MKGFHAKRIEPTLGGSADRERAFAEEWEKINDPVRNPLNTTVGHLIPNCTERDAQVAATVAQWLGTNVGMAFIIAVAEKCPHVRRTLALIRKP